MTDNGLGKKHNSYDVMLYMHNFKFNFEDSSYKLVETIFFNDKNKKYKYPITTEATKERYLSGSDFDLESFQLIGGDFWIEDEFGPFLLHFDRSGTLKEVFEVYVDNKELLSPDNPKLKFADLPEGKNMEFNIKRSRGFEAMASYDDMLYLLLEGGICNEDSYESVNGKEFLRIIEFDTKSKKYTNNTYKYFPEDKSRSIGDFNMIDKHYGLIIERDSKEGVADKQCMGKNTSNCFDNVAKFKRIYKVKLESGEAKK